MCFGIWEPEWEMGNGKSGGKRGAGTGLFTGLTGLSWSLNAVPALWETVRASPNIPKFPSRIRKAIELETVLIYQLKLILQLGHCFQHFSTQ